MLSGRNAPWTVIWPTLRDLTVWRQRTADAQPDEVHRSGERHSSIVELVHLSRPVSTSVAAPHRGVAAARGTEIGARRAPIAT